MTTKTAKGPNFKRQPRWAKYTLITIQVVTALMISHVLNAMPYWTVLG